jgi:hypothetical protein
VTENAKNKQKKIDKALDMTFPASDPVASGKATGTEPPKRPVDRRAPIVSREEIERARQGAGQGDPGNRTLGRSKTKKRPARRGANHR